MKKEKEYYLRWIKLIAYVCGLIMIVAGFIYGFKTEGNDFFKIQIETQEKKDIVMTIVSGMVLILEGIVISYVEKKDSVKSILLLTLCLWSSVDLIFNIVLYGITYFFSYIGIMDFIFGIINIIILTFVLKIREKNNK